MSGVDPELILPALQRLAESSASSEAIRRESILLGTEVIVAETTAEGSVELLPDELARRTRIVLREMTTDLGEQDGAAVERYLGLDPGGANAPYPVRKARAADILGIQPDSLTHRHPGGTRAQGLLASFAQAISDRDVAYQLLRQQREMRQRRAPQESALRVPWIDLFQNYYRVWTAISGLDADIHLAISARGRKDQEQAERYDVDSLFFYAVFLAARRDFERSHGGLWLLPQPDVEQRVADAVWHISDDGPFTLREDSTLRILLRSADEEAAIFAPLLEGEDVASLKAKWRSWLDHCACGGSPDPNCGPHQMATYCQTFLEGINDGWDALSDWYQAQRPASSVDDALAKRFSESRSSVDP